VLIDAGSTLTTEDLATLRNLYEASIPARVLLSKADLLSPADRVRSVQYVTDHIRSQLGTELSAHPVSTRGEDAGLLEEWFTQHLLPIFERHQELSEQSLRRKIGALREAVEAALRVRLELSEKRPASEKKHLRAAENRLRKATGRFEGVNRYCLNAADGVRELGETALSRAASEVVELWFRKKRAGDSARDVLLRSITGAAAEGANSVFVATLELAGDLAEALTKAAIALEARDATSEEELAALIKEMPRFDIGTLNVKLLPDFWTMFGKRLTKRRVTNKLQREIGPTITAAFHSYGSVLESWSRKTLGELRHQFEAHADGYRVQLERLTGTAPTSEGSKRSVVIWTCSRSLARRRRHP